MAPSFQERRDAIFGGDGPVATDYSLAWLFRAGRRSPSSRLCSER
jgi:hypothetical protein